MHDLDRIEALLANKRIDSELFERFAQDALSEVYPGLSSNSQVVPTGVETPTSRAPTHPCNG